MVWFQLNNQTAEAIREIELSPSERIVAVVSGALLDQALHHAIQTRMRNDEATMRRLFKGTGPLSGANKIHLGFLLYMFDEPMRDAMIAVSDIRNLFAHELGMSFKFKRDDRMRKAFSVLVLHQGRPYFPSPFWEGDSEYPLDPVTDERSQFLVNLRLCLIWLRADDNKHLAYSNEGNEPGFKPPLGQPAQRE